MQLNSKVASSCIALVAVVALAAAIPANLIGQSIVLERVDSNIALRAADGSAAGFRHFDGGTGNHLIVEYVSAGLATFDYDQDGDVDLYFLNGRGSPDSIPAANRLFRNDGNWTFTDVTNEAGVGDTEHGLGVAVADYDNDGFPDLYVTNYGPNRLYRNNGDGTFTELARKARVDNGDRVGAGAAFVDVDRDGWLDLYVANYIKLTAKQRVKRTMKGNSVYASPLDYEPEADMLYRNNQDGTFSDISNSAGISKQVAYGMGIVCFDYDLDGDSDVFVGNDVGANFLFQNDGRGVFTEIGLPAGCAYDGRGGIQGTMGVDVGDYDNAGYLDLHVTSYQNEWVTLYRNVNGLLFEDATNVSGAGKGTHSQVTWGNGIVDFDNDGHQDLFVACGHLHDNVEEFDDRTSYRAKNMVFSNDGDATFTDVSATAGSGLTVKLSSRGACFDDLDNDGDLDVVVLNSRDEPTLLRNESKPTRNWLKITLRGTQCNRNGIGSRIVVTAGDLKQTREMVSGRGYQSHYGSTVHFGLGQHDVVKRIEVHWLGGNVMVRENIEPNQTLEIRE